MRKTPELAKLEAAVKAEFPDEWASGVFYSLGIYNCRRKNRKPGGAWSEHAWGNAIDIGVRVKEAGDRLAAWARRSGLASEVFWQVRYHYNHVHITAQPRRNFDNKQTPPCAGGDHPHDPEDDDMKLTKLIQEALNEVGFRDYQGKILRVDGIPGPRTKSAVVAALKAAKNGSGGSVDLVVSEIVKRLTNG